MPSGFITGAKSLLSPLAITWWTLYVVAVAVVSGTADVPQWWTDCINQGIKVMEGKTASQDVLNCCAVFWGCDCVAKQCASHKEYKSCANPAASCRTNCSSPGNWTLPSCNALPTQNFFTRNPWIWLVVVGGLIAVIVLVILVVVSYKKFGKNDKKNKKGHIALGHEMNITSSVQAGHGDKKSHRKRRKDNASFASKKDGGSAKVPAALETYSQPSKGGSKAPITTPARGSSAKLTPSVIRKAIM